MLKKIFVGCGVGVLSAFIALPVSAQETATIVTRDGQRQTGELVDLNASGFTLRVNGQDRQIAETEVAAIEFVAGEVPAAARAILDADQPVVVLRSGQVVVGRLSDIGGTRPLRLTVDTTSGDKDYTSNEVARVYLHATQEMAQKPPEAPAVPPAGAITVLANQAWTKTGVTVRRGERIAFSTSGEIALGNDQTSNPAGNAAATIPEIKYPVFNAPVGALIARVGTSAPFTIGTSSQPIPMPANGELLLGINDDNVADNSGAYTVTIDRQRQDGARPR